MEMDYVGKVAVASGAASGMGLVFSRNIVARGGNMVMADINAGRLAECVDELNAMGPGKALGVVCDVREYAQVCHVRDAAVEAFGRVDLVVNFAGGTATRVLGVDGQLEFPDIPIEVFDWGIDVNLRAQFYFGHAMMKQMREQKSGLIINIGSITGVEGDGHGMDYPTAKSGAMNGLTTSLAQYGAQYGIRCVCVSPGPVLTRPAMARMKTLLGRAADPQEIIDLILFLDSPQGQFINGTNIMIDGGRAAMPRA